MKKIVFAFCVLIIVCVHSLRSRKSGKNKQNQGQYYTIDPNVKIYSFPTQPLQMAPDPMFSQGFLKDIFKRGKKLMYLFRNYWSR